MTKGARRREHEDKLNARQNSRNAIRRRQYAAMVGQPLHARRRAQKAQAHALEGEAENPDYSDTDRLPASPAVMRDSFFVEQFIPSGNPYNSYNPSYANIVSQQSTTRITSAEYYGSNGESCNSMWTVMFRNGGHAVVQSLDSLYSNDSLRGAEREVDEVSRAFSTRCAEERQKKQKPVPWYRS